MPCVTCPGYSLVTGFKYSDILAVMQIDKKFIPTAAALVGFDPTFTDLEGFILKNNHWFYFLPCVTVNCSTRSMERRYNAPLYSGRCKFQYWENMHPSFDIYCLPIDWQRRYQQHAPHHSLPRLRLQKSIKAGNPNKCSSIYAYQVYELFPAQDLLFCYNSGRLFCIY